MLKDREQAAQLLSQRLIKYRGKNPLILAIPRGAVPMAKTIANSLQGELDIVLVHKLRAPRQPELAVGSVDENGHIYVGPHAAMVGADQAYLKNEAEEQVKILKQRRERYRPGQIPFNPTGRIVIVVDDGIATGSSMIAALRTLKREKPEKLVAAVAVASYEGLETIKSYADEVECLIVPDEFFSVSQFFEEFEQVSDEEAIRLLRQDRS